MKVQINKEDGKYVAAYPYKYHGFEFIYVKSSIGKTLLFENRLAIKGIWLNDNQIAEMIQPIIDGKYHFKDGSPLISLGNEIIIHSYKHRGIGVYNKNGVLSKQTPDFTRSLEIVNQ